MVAGKIGAVADRKVRMASKTARAAEKLNGGSGKMEDMAVKTDEAAKNSKTIGKEDGGCGEEVKDYRQRRRRMSATNLRQCRRSSGQGLRDFCVSGRCANGLKTNCLEWQKTRRWPRFLPKNAAKMKKKGQKG